MLPPTVTRQHEISTCSLGAGSGVGGGAERGQTCNRNAGVLQQAVDEPQALVAMPDGPLDVELVHHQGLASSICHP